MIKFKSFLWKCFCKCFFMMEELKDYVEMRSQNKKYKPTKPRKMGEKLLLLGNGPSCNDYLQNRELFKDYDILCVNFFVSKNEKEFREIKPKYICFADPAFATEESEQIDKVMKIINEIDWNCYIISSASHKFTKIKNPNLKHIKISSYQYEKDNERREDWYCKNLAIPFIANVINLALFFGISFKYEKIGLIGVESDFQKDLRVDKDNNVYTQFRHYYDTSCDIQEIKLNINLKDHYFFLHKNLYTDSVLNILAGKFGCKITNYTLNSLIDVFEKKEMIKGNV